MEYSPRTRTIASICSDITKNRLNFNHPYQRKEGVWSLLQKSNLIKAILEGDYIDPVKAEKINGLSYIFDGQQRLSTVYNFMNDNLKLSKALDPITVNGNDYSICSKKFSDLDEELQSAIRDFEFTIVYFRDCTEDDRKKIFLNQNAGTPLSKLEKLSTFMNYELGEKVIELSDHPFIQKILTPTQIKKSEDRSVVYQVLLALSDAEFNGFDPMKDIAPFLDEFSENINYALIERIKYTLDVLNADIDVRPVNLKKLIPPLLIIGMAKAIDEGKEKNYIVWFYKFISSYDTQSEFLSYCSGGTTKAPNVHGRIDFFTKAVDQLEKDAPVAVTSDVVHNVSTSNTVDNVDKSDKKNDSSKISKK